MKHGIVMMDSFFNFCAATVLTQERKYSSLLELLNSNDLYEEKYHFIQLSLSDLTDIMTNFPDLLTIEEVEEMWYHLQYSTPSDPEYHKALRDAWMLIRSTKGCDANGCDNTN